MYVFSVDTYAGLQGRKDDLDFSHRLSLTWKVYRLFRRGEDFANEGRKGLREERKDGITINAATDASTSAIVQRKKKRRNAAV